MLRLTTNSLPPILSVQDLNHHANYEHLSCVASLLSGLAKYRDAFVIDVIDSLLENIQVTLERNDFREMPLRVRQVKLVGELYNYRLVDSVLVFDSLYQCAGFIGFGGPSSFRASQHITAGELWVVEGWQMKAHKLVERVRGLLFQLQATVGSERWRWALCQAVLFFHFAPAESQGLAMRKGGLGSITEENEATKNITFVRRIFAPGYSQVYSLPAVLVFQFHRLRLNWPLQLIDGCWSPCADGVTPPHLVCRTLDAAWQPLRPAIHAIAAVA
ncbi:unnamed protein product [Durusdinium trenchii]|uniref:MIF4G domain-containing protein n=1 Tax=Durusdinium trenchii TaxID=1381693 RepID=A0ABP0JFY7_9DINO